MILFALMSTSIRDMYLRTATADRSLFKLSAMMYDKMLETMAKTTITKDTSLISGICAIHEGNESEVNPGKKEITF